MPQGNCPCGAPAREAGLCAFCLEHSPANVIAVVRRLRDRIALLEGALGTARAAIDRDRTGLAKALNEVQKEVQAYRWIPAGEWGSYSSEERTATTLRREVANCFESILKVAATALIESGRLATKTVLTIDAELRRAL